MKTLSNWRSVRTRELGIERDLRQRHHLWLHGWCIGLLVIGFMWAMAHLQFMLGSDSLAIRYLVTLSAGYVGYLGILRMWAGTLIWRQKSSTDDLLFDLPGSGIGNDLPRFEGGGGGDFGGGGASGDFSAAAEASSGLGKVASGALEIAASADEGAVVVVPVVAIFLIGVALIFGTGSLIMLYFDWDVLLAVAVELGFGYVSGRTAIRLARDGWLPAAVQLTWKPLLGALFCAVLLGATIDYFIPSAHSLPQAVRLIRLSY